MNKRNDFICIGAVHSDYLLNLKQNYFKNRTNPIIQKENLGGVAYNVAKTLAFLDQKTNLYSINCNKDQKNEIKKNGIFFKSISQKIEKRYYASIIDRNGKMIFGLANMDNYEKIADNHLIKKFKNKNIILDLNLSKKLIEKIINTNHHNNYICVCGTSAHKIYKIKSLLKKINTLILNKQESFKLTNKKSIKDSLRFLSNKNKKLNIIITNGKNSVNAYIKNIYYLSYPNNIRIKNENGAGDTLSAVFNYFYCNNYDILESLNKSICAGMLQASGYNKKKVNYLKKVQKLSKSIRYKIIN